MALLRFDEGEMPASLAVATTGLEHFGAAGFRCRDAVADRQQAKSIRAAVAQKTELWRQDARPCLPHVNITRVPTGSSRPRCAISPIWLTREGEQWNFRLKSQAL
jgi:hypothetical protein